MNRILSLLICLLVVVLPLSAQQLPQFSLGLLDVTTQNPASVGMQESMIINGHFRSQWVSIPGSPLSSGVSVHTPLYLVGGGLGIQLQQDSYGAEQILRGALAYSKHLSLGEGILGIGGRVGFNQHQLDGGKLRTATGDYSEDVNLPIHNDEILPTGVFSLTGLNFSIGAYFKTERIEGGIATYQLAENPLSDANFTFDKTRHYFATFKAHFPLSYSVDLTPGIQMRTDANEIQADLSLLATYNEKFTVGALYRGYNKTSQDALAIILGIPLNTSFKVHYSYDIGLSALNMTGNNGSHEILVSYTIPVKFGSGRLPNIIYNPRNL